MIHFKTRNALQVLFTGLIFVLIAYLGAMGAPAQYEELKKPLLAIAGKGFGTAWAVLYCLMLGATILIELQSLSGIHKKDALGTFWLQMILNVLWPYLFFVFRFRSGAFFCLLVLLYFAWLTQIRFQKLSKAAGLLFLPYPVFLVYTLYLNFFLWILN